jgi:hypothetical protein
MLCEAYTEVFWPFMDTNTFDIGKGWIILCVTLAVLPLPKPV